MAPRLSLSTIAALLIAATAAFAQDTERRYLSGTDKDNTVAWDFMVTVDE